MLAVSSFNADSFTPVRAMASACAPSPGRAHGSGPAGPGRKSAPGRPDGGAGPGPNSHREEWTPMRHTTTVRVAEAVHRVRPLLAGGWT